MRIIYSFILILYFSTISFAYGEFLSFNMSISPAIENGFNVTNVIGTLTRNGYSTSKNFSRFGTNILGIFDNLTANTYTLSIEIYDDNILIANGLAEGAVSVGDTNYVKARLAFACGKLILIVNWLPDDPVNVECFYSYSIDPENHHLKLYQDINNISNIASNYKESMMSWFYPSDVDYSILDSNMVPIKHYSFGDYRNPVTVCHTAFGFYNNYLEAGEDIDKQGFLNNVNWLLDYHDLNYYLHYEFDWYHYPVVYLDEGWISAMAQGGALGATSMAYCLTTEAKYLEAAEGFFTTLYSNTDSLWCIAVDNEDYYWLEEYPNKDFCHVLNGMLYALWGIWDYYVISSDEFALTLFKAGMKTIADNYPIWNVEGEDNSYYCLHHNKYDKYHQVHLLQLEKFAEIFDIPEFRDAIKCFSQDKSSIELVSTNEISPNEIVAYQNHPNPFNTETMIKYYLPRNLKLTLKIYNILGREITTLVNEEKKIGFNQVQWYGKNNIGVDMPSGIYVYKIFTNRFVKTKKMILIR